MVILVWKTRHNWISTLSSFWGIQLLLSWMPSIFYTLYRRASGRCTSMSNEQSHKRIWHPTLSQNLKLKVYKFFLHTVLNFFTSIQYKTSPHSYILGDKGSKFKEKYLTMRRWFVGCKSDFQKHYEKTWLQMVEMDQEKVTHQNESDYKTRQELSAHLLWQNVF